ncbi:hypothetical protein [Herbaspirillum robiniae]|uniref:hypothetical protein n=1 Tax=Herbaspirillum robiniae TaxID=2014887 RepID=UPI003D78785A
MRQSILPIPNFAQVFGAGIGSVSVTPVASGQAPEPGPIDKEIRRINSAHEPAVREVASDNELGRDIVDEDARRLAAQSRSVKKNERVRQAQRVQDAVDGALEDSFPASDPVDRSRGA